MRTGPVPADAKKVVPDGDLRVLGSQIKYRGLLINSIDIDGNLLQRKLDLPTCKVVFNKDNFIDAKGNALLEDPYNYDADATVQFQDLGFLNELTKSFGQDLGLAGKLNAGWKGKRTTEKWNRRPGTARRPGEDENAFKALNLMRPLTIKD